LIYDVCPCAWLFWWVYTHILCRWIKEQAFEQKTIPQPWMQLIQDVIAAVSFKFQPSSIASPKDIRDVLLLREDFDVVHLTVPPSPCHPWPLQYDFSVLKNSRFQPCKSPTRPSFASINLIIKLKDWNKLMLARGTSSIYLGQQKITVCHLDPVKWIIMQRTLCPAINSTTCCAEQSHQGGHARHFHEHLIHKHDLMNPRSESANCPT
jgi:hypothetical protein